MEDFVKCLFCQNENVKTVEYLDLPLAIRADEGTEALKSLVGRVSRTLSFSMRILSEFPLSDVSY